MATNLHIDEKLLSAAVKAGGKKTKRETVNEALEEYIRRRAQMKILELKGTLDDKDFWDANLSSHQNGKSRGNGK